MTRFGVAAQFEVLPGKEDDAQRFFQAGELIVDQQPATTRWYAFRNGTTSYGAFAVFVSETDREALLTSGGPSVSAANAELFARLNMAPTGLRASWSVNNRSVRVAHGSRTGTC